MGANLGADLKNVAKKPHNIGAFLMEFMEPRGVEPLSKHLATSTPTTIELVEV